MDAQTAGWMALISTACVALFGSGDWCDPGARARALKLDLRERDNNDIRRLRQAQQSMIGRDNAQ